MKKRNVTEESRYIRIITKPNTISKTYLQDSFLSMLGLKFTCLKSLQKLLENCKDFIKHLLLVWHVGCI